MKFSLHRVLAGLALAAGLLAVFAGSPYAAKPVSALELARWIKDRKPGLRVIDLRSAADFENYHVPGAQHVALEAFESAAFHPDETLVLISDGMIVRAMRNHNVYFLRGGIHEWLDAVMNSKAASQEAAALSRYFGGVPRTGDVKRSNTAAAVRRRGC